MQSPTTTFRQVLSFEDCIYLNNSEQKLQHTEN